MKLEALTQFIVPLVFLAIWALTSLLNRDGQPLPQRPARPGTGPPPGGQGGGRRDAFESTRDEDSAPAVPGPSPSRRSSSASLDPRPVDRPAPAPARSSPSRPPTGRALDADVYVLDDEVVFVDPLTRRPIASTPLAPGGAGQRTSPRGTPPRKTGRARRSEPSQSRPRRSEPETQRILSEEVGQSMAQNRSQPLTLSPLNSKLTSLTSAALRDAPTESASVAPTNGPPALSASAVRNMMADGLRLRELAVIADLLQPPLSLRRSGRRR